jgi:hypothetical protein
MMIGSFASGTMTVTDFFPKPVELFIAGPGQELQDSDPLAFTFAGLSDAPPMPIARLSIPTQTKAHKKIHDFCFALRSAS